MNVPVTLLALVFATYSSLSFGVQCAATNGITDPEQFVWTYVSDENDPHYVGTMEIAEADLVIGGETIHTRVYRQEGGCDSIPGPTLNMVPGEKYVLKFRNRLPYEPKSEAHNVFKDPNVSNLHTHGVHISGETPGDDVTRSFEGGAGGDFVYHIPLDHMGGTFWYHAHHHGSTYLQVSGGAFGLIVIDDQFDNIPTSVAAMTERQLVIAFLDPNVAGNGGDTLISGTLSPTWTVNGKVNGTLTMPPNTWQHWRVLLADRDARMKTVSVGSQCEVALMARDGVWRTTVPKPLSSNSINLTGASRADLAVRCGANASLLVGGQAVANVVVQGTANASPSPYNTNGSTWISQRPGYLRDLRGASLAHSETINMGARTINGSKWDHHVPNFTLQTNGVQEFNLKGATNHPFHLHIYHVQVQSACGDFEAGEYYDVLASNCTLRFDLSPTNSTPYSGRTVMHCHILEHEDQGAMGWADVIGGEGPPVFPAGFAYTDYIPPVILPGNPPAAPSNLAASAASSSQIDLTWSDNSNNETLFNIQRSTDGSSFSFHASVTANVNSYSDTGLGANTPYWYQVNAENLDGGSAFSNVATATTLTATTGTALALRSITVSTVSAAKGQKRQRAVVVVEDNTGSLVSGAVVTGSFSGTITENDRTGTTGTDGSTTIDTTGTAKGTFTFEFCVTSITHAGLTSFVKSYGEACSSL